MANEVTIPILPCSNLRGTLEFYVALGFRITSEQHAPYVYGGVEFENIQLHFHGSKKLVPNTESSHTTLIITQDVDALHQTFVRGIKATFGKQLRTGIPRIGSVNSFSRDRRFNLLDPSGNRLIVVQTLSKEKLAQQKAGTKFAKALENARKFAYSKDDAKGAAKILEVAFAKNEPESDAVRFRAYVLRADVANILDDIETSKRYMLEARNVELTESDKLELAEELARLGKLENLLADEQTLGSAREGRV